MKKNFFTKASTPPNEDSLKWAGTQNSILANILLWGLWFLRAISALQWIKVLYRAQPLRKLRNHLREKKAKNSLGQKELTQNVGSDRPDVPVMVWEGYFLFWCALLLCFNLFSLNSLVFKIIAGYGLMETITWIVYYTVFRRFFEDKYSIYHELEALTLLLLIIPTEALGFSVIYEKRFDEILAGLVGAGGDETPLLVGILGALFAAIVVAMIISTFPTEKIKKSFTKMRTVIIGAGDVVSERLYPAVKNSGIVRSVDVLDIKGEKENAFARTVQNDSTPKLKTSYKAFKTDAEICKEVKNIVTGDSVVWIETPSDSHVSYLKKLLKDTKASLIVVEKPICTSLSELSEVKKLISEPNKRQRIFFLSYYILEKALPLYYLSEANPIFAKYLYVEDKSIVRNWRLFMGELKSIDVSFNEGIDNREWTFNQQHGGQLLETFIHNTLIASLFCGVPQTWKSVLFSKKLPDEIQMTAKSQNTDIHLYLKKNTQDESLLERTATLIFANGKVEVDFDKKQAKIFFNELNKSCLVGVKEEYMGKYSILTDLVARVKEEECTSEEADGLINQIETIAWLIEQNK